PLGLLPTAVIFDIAYLSSHNAQWTEISYWLIAVGILGALLAAVFGIVDWVAIPAGTRAKRIGMLHGGGSLVVVGLFVASWYLRDRAAGIPSTLAITLGFIGVALAVVTGWLGGELVDRLGVGVDEGANLDAPSSLSHTHVTGTPHPA